MVVTVSPMPKHSEKIKGIYSFMQVANNGVDDDFQGMCTLVKLLSTSESVDNI